MDLATWRSGHTLLELTVAIAIVGIVAGIGWTAIQNEVDRFRMMKAARLLQSDLQSLRALAITTNRETRIHFIAADAALSVDEDQVGEWTLQAGNRSTNSTVWDTLPIDDDNADGSQGERSLSVGGLDETPHVSLAPWPALVGPGTDNADAIVFSPRGWVSNPATDFADGYVALRIVDKRGQARGEAGEAVVRLSRGGLSRLEVSDATSLPATSVGTGEATTP
jgi:prepilin-type N-terminal cleavage/methylation domain-containing protein